MEIPIGMVMVIPNLKARTALAAEIAGVDRQRFNEAVAEDFYPCAPRTVRGAARVFTVNDILTLWVYGRQLDEGVPPRKAGRVACGLSELLAEYPEADRVVYITNSYGASVWHLSHDLPIENRRMGGGDIVSVKEWFLGPVRMRVIRELEEEANTLGGDE
jgi:hypothetical protein